MNDWTNLADAARLGGWVIYPLTVLAIAALAITLDRAYVVLAVRANAEMVATGGTSAWHRRRLPWQTACRRQHALSRLGRLLDDTACAAVAHRSASRSSRRADRARHEPRPVAARDHRDRRAAARPARHDRRHDALVQADRRRRSRQSRGRHGRRRAGARSPRRSGSSSPSSRFLRSTTFRAASTG